jgi:hypothetical protein
MPARFASLARLRIVPMLMILLCAAPPAIGQVIYKSTMPDGSVLYGDAPAPGAVKVESGHAPASKGVAPVSPEQEKRIETEQNQYFSDLQRARDEVSAAEAALTQAQAERDAGQEPLPGERQSQRLTAAYFERQRALDEAVKNARSRLEKANAALKQVELQ